MTCIVLAEALRRAGGPEQALPLVDEAQRRFETIMRDRPGSGAERMVSSCVEERGHCLLGLGRLDEARDAYEECVRRAEHIGDDREAAVGNGQLGTVHLLQRRYRDALASYQQARERFMRLDEPGSVAAIWHQTGMVYQHAGQPEAAEDAYRKALAIKVRLGDVAGQASTLGQLGTLYDNALHRPEEAVRFHRQAADKYVEIGDVANEGRVRNNLGDTLRRVRRLDEARQEIHRAIECNERFGHALEPWTSWSIFAQIEVAAGKLVAATEARHKAIAAYLAYRRDGGENHTYAGRICLPVTQALLGDDPAGAISLLQQLAADSDLPKRLLPFLQALQTVAAGSRDPALATSDDLPYDAAAEILFLIETLEQAPAPPPT